MIKTQWIFLSTTIAIVTGSLTLNTEAAKSEVKKYFCGTSNGFPTLFAKTSDSRNSVLFRFTSEYFSARGLTPEKRCRDSAYQFNTFNLQGLLQVPRLTTERRKKASVICISQEENASSCRAGGVLLFFNPEINPDRILREIIQRNRDLTMPVPNDAGDLFAP